MSFLLSNIWRQDSTAPPPPLPVMNPGWLIQIAGAPVVCEVAR